MGTQRTRLTALESAGFQSLIFSSCPYSTKQSTGIMTNAAVLEKVETVVTTYSDDQQLDAALSEKLAR